MATTPSHRDARFLAAFLDDRLGLAQIAESLNISLLDLIAWADSPHIRQALDTLQRLAETRLRLRAAPIRAAAIDTLHQLLDCPGNPVEARRIATTLVRATGGKPPSTARSALAPNSGDAQAPESTPPATAAPTAASATPTPATNTTNRFVIAAATARTPALRHQPPASTPEAPPPEPPLLLASRRTPTTRLASRAGAPPDRKS